MSVEILNEDAAERVAEALGIASDRIKSITVEFFKDKTVAEIFEEARIAEFDE